MGFARSLADKRYYVKTGDVERLSSAVLDDNTLFALIDTIDFEISAARDRMIAIAGTDRRGIEELLKGSGSPKASELAEIRSTLQSALMSASKEHDELVKEMEKISSKIKSDADTLSNHLRLDPFAR